MRAPFVASLAFVLLAACGVQTTMNEDSGPSSQQDGASIDTGAPPIDATNVDGWAPIDATNVDCREEPCPGFNYCEELSGRCLAGCAADEQCGVDQQCNITTHACECRGCTSPPGPCHQATGECDGAGRCQYDLVPAGTSCDDRNPCTLDDVCAAGTCGGEPLVCEPPPEPVCFGDTIRSFASATCADGACHYAESLRTCPEGCVSGACCPSWTFGEVTASGLSRGSVQFTGIAASAAGVPELAYYDLQIELATPIGSGWSSAFLASAAKANGGGALVIDASGGRHLAYWRQASEESSQLGYVGPSGTIESRPSAGGLNAAMVVDASGRVHIVSEAESGLVLGMRYSQRSPSGEWFDYMLDANGRSPALALEGSNVHLVYRVSNELFYRRWSPASYWSDPVMIEDEVTNDQLSISVSSSGEVHVSYTTQRGEDSFSDVVNYAWNNAGTWEITKVAWGAHDSTVLVDAESIYLAYIDAREAAVIHIVDDPSEFDDISNTDIYTGALDTLRVIRDARGGFHVAGTRSGFMYYGHRGPCEP